MEKSLEGGSEVTHGGSEGVTRPLRSGWARALSTSLAAGLLFLLAGDRGAQTAPPPGIDPLDVLNLEVRPNVFLVLDSSASMAQTTSGNPVPGDERRAKLSLAKQILTSIIQTNETRVNFQFGQYEQPIPSLTVPTDTRWVYETFDPNAASILANTTGMPATSDTLVRVTTRFPSNPACPGTSPCSFAETAGTTYKLAAGKFFNGDHVLVRADGKCSAVVGNDGPAAPAYVNMQIKADAGPCALDTLVGTGPVVKFTFQGVDSWSGWGDATTCGGFQSLVPMAPCSQNVQLTSIAPFLQDEILTNPDGSIQGYTEDLATNGAVVTEPTLGGIRAAGRTPLNQTYLDLKTLFNTLWTGTISAQTVKQRTFSIVVTGGDDTCPGPTVGAGATDNYALGAAFGAQQLRDRISPPDPESSVTSFLIAFGSGVSATRANWIAWGGSGLVEPTVNDDNGTGTPADDFVRWASAPAQAERDACFDCQDAFLAATAADLRNALQAAIERAADFGEFSTVPPIIGTVFELSPDDPATPELETALDPQTRYRTRVNILFQSTFELPGWLGHLRAFQNDGTFLPVPSRNRFLNVTRTWDAGETLNEQVSQAGLELNSRSGRFPDNFTFQELHADKSARDIGDPACAPPAAVTPGWSPASCPVLRRRVFTSEGNGRFLRPSQSQYDSASAAGSNVVALWPPNQAGLTSSITGASDSTTGVNPPVGTAGPFDDALGIGAGSNPVATFAQLKEALGACDGSTDTSSGPIPPACGASDINAARKEAREILLAYIAGAQVQRSTAVDGRPLRAQDASNSGKLLYRSRRWLLPETTLGTLAVSNPFLREAPDLHTQEWIVYRDGRRDVNGNGIDETDQGYGIQNPDLDNANPQSLLALKPRMTVVFIAANDMLHAFSAETSEELWGFIPFDQLGKIKNLVRGQSRDPHTYVAASAIRQADVFIPGVFTLDGIDFAGRWRRVLFFGRGAGGKYYTALDVSAPGPFTREALLTNPPWVLWNRGNPDTRDGRTTGDGGTMVRDATDYDAYLGMGQTWSVPAVGNVPESIDATTCPEFPASKCEWIAFTGSGFGSTANEGTTLYALDVVTGDVVMSRDVGDGPSTFFTDNALVAPASAFNSFRLDISGVTNRGPDRTSRVYIPDIHGRIWKFNTTTYGQFADVGPDQPIGNAVALMKINGTGFVFAEAGNDRRVAPPPSATPPFKMFGFTDTQGDALSFTLEAPTFTQPFPSPFRGVVQPATAFSVGGQARVFFAGHRFNPPSGSCVSSFDTILFALNADTGGAAYDFNNNGVNDVSVIVAGTSVTGVQTVAGQVVLGGGGGVGGPPSPNENTVLAAAPQPTPKPATVSVTSLLYGTPVCRSQ